MARYKYSRWLKLKIAKEAMLKPGAGACHCRKISCDAVDSNQMEGSSSGCWRGKCI